MSVYNNGLSLGLSKEIFRNKSHEIGVNKHRYLLSLVLAFFLKFLKRLYRDKKNNLHKEYPLLPRELWKNDFSIVMVHGFGGYSPDESIFFGNYFSYASDVATQGPDNLLYHADISPWGSIHDRACELYQ